MYPRLFFRFTPHVGCFSSLSFYCATVIICILNPGFKPQFYSNFQHHFFCCAFFLAFHLQLVSFLLLYHFCPFLVYLPVSLLSNSSCFTHLIHAYANRSIHFLGRVCSKVPLHFWLLFATILLIKSTISSHYSKY